MARFIEIKCVNPKLRQDQIAKKIGCSKCTLRRYAKDVNMLSPYRTPPKNHNRKQKISIREHDLERPQMTAKDLRRPQLTSKGSFPVNETVKPNTTKKNKLKGGSNIEVNEE